MALHVGGMNRYAALREKSVRVAKKAEQLAEAAVSQAKKGHKDRFATRPLPSSPPRSVCLVCDRPTMGGTVASLACWLRSHLLARNSEIQGHTFPNAQSG